MYEEKLCNGDSHTLIWPSAPMAYHVIIQILDGGESTTVYGTKKSDNGRGEAESIIAFLSPVNCIVDELPSNICYIIHRPGNR